MTRFSNTLVGKRMLRPCADGRRQVLQKNPLHMGLGPPMPEVMPISPARSRRSSRPLLAWRGPQDTGHKTQDTHAKAQQLPFGCSAAQTLKVTKATQVLQVRQRKSGIITLVAYPALLSRVLFQAARGGIVAPCSSNILSRPPHLQSQPRSLCEDGGTVVLRGCVDDLHSKAESGARVEAKRKWKAAIVVVVVL